MDTSRLRDLFQQQFGSQAEVCVFAPGRVNLIGEHTDYNDGFVCPMAIEPGIYFAARRRNDQQIHLASTSFPDTPVTLDLDAAFTKTEPAWGNYPRAMADKLKAAAIPLTGFDALLVADLPEGGGLSSSAALLVGFGKLCMAVGGHELEAGRLAVIAQAAEREMVQCGIMDQMIIACAQPDSAMMLDCRDLSRRFIPVPKDVSIVVVNTMVKHALTDGGYDARVKQCKAGLAALSERFGNLQALRDATPEMVEALAGEEDDTVYRRCRHVVREIARVGTFADFLAAGNYAAAGKLMLESHVSLAKDYEVSCDELDWIVDFAGNQSGVYGTRMTGGGFGGCTVSLVKPEAVEGFIAEVKPAYADRWKKNPVAFATRPVGGARVIR
ncbi:MAG: galactokinase [Phycisphaerae bacterium]